MVYRVFGCTILLWFTGCSGALYCYGLQGVLVHYTGMVYRVFWCTILLWFTGCSGALYCYGLQGVLVHYTAMVYRVFRCTILQVNCYNLMCFFFICLGSHLGFDYPGVWVHVDMAYPVYSVSAVMNAMKC